STAYAATELEPIRPQFQGTVTISCGVASSATALASIAAFQSQVQLEVQNAGTATVFVETGSSLVTSAVATGYPVLVGQRQVISVGPRVTHIGCITGSGTQTVYVTVGQGT